MTIASAPLTIPPQFAALVASAESFEGIPRNMLAALLQHESGWNLDAVGDGGEAYGLGQMHSAAAESVGGHWAAYSDKSIPDADRAALQINDAAAYLALCHRALGDWQWALAAYNQGPTVMRRGRSYAEVVMALAGGSP